MSCVTLWVTAAAERLRCDEIGVDRWWSRNLIPIRKPLDPEDDRLASVRGQNKRQRLKASAVEPVLDVCAFSAWLHPGAHLGPAPQTTNSNARERK
jgi:hypothetical protein